jgi:hypothetical protein
LLGGEHLAGGFEVRDFLLGVGEAGDAVLGEFADDLEGQADAGDSLDGFLDGDADQALEEFFAPGHPAAHLVNHSPRHDSALGTGDGSLLVIRR